MKRLGRVHVRLVCGIALVAGGLAVLARRADRAAELRRLLAGLDGTAAPLTYQDLVDTDGDPVPEDGDPWASFRRRGSES